MPPLPDAFRAGGRKPGALSRLAAWWGPRPVTQIAVILGVAALAYMLATNTVASMARAGISPGFDFLSRAANFGIGETPIAFHAGDTYARALLAGLLNTAKVALLGCILSTVLGVALGVARLSGNLLLSSTVRWYIEIVRNTPLLLQLFLWIALAQALPGPRQAITFFDSVFLSNRGVFVPRIVLEDVPAWGVLAAIAALILWVAYLWNGRRQARNTVRSILASTALLAAVLIAIALMTGTRAALERPALAGFNIRGGASLTPEFSALLLGLTIKFSAAIAEVVRAGILSVKSGQWEAARALGLRNGQIMWRVVLPQALRIITPLTTSNYLDLIKDSSLAVAIGYPDLVNIVNTTANTTGQAFEALLILILVYLSINLAVSLAMNIYNRRIALRGEQPA